MCFLCLFPVHGFPISTLLSVFTHFSYLHMSTSKFCYNLQEQKTAGMANSDFYEKDVSLPSRLHCARLSNHCIGEVCQVYLEGKCNYYYMYCLFIHTAIHCIAHSICMKIKETFNWNLKEGIRNIISSCNCICIYALTYCFVNLISLLAVFREAIEWTEPSLFLGS